MNSILESNGTGANPSGGSLAVERAVRNRYQAAARAREESLCCPVNYDPAWLEVIPPEVLEKDYGCGNPCPYLHPGDTVLDLGCGCGKVCFIAAQAVGSTGRVIGVDMTGEMLEVARRNAPIVAARLGYANVEFRQGRIQDLALDLERLEVELQRRPIANAASFLAAEELAGELRLRHPLVSSDSIDVVVSNCVLNLVEPRSKTRLFDEMFRVLRPGGRAVISDIVSDEPVPARLQHDPNLWSGCISGALTEEGFLEMFRRAGFHGIQILKRADAPWRTVEGLEFRSVTVQACKGRPGPGYERNQAVVYLGPFREVRDDHQHCFERGKRHAVCDQTYQRLQEEPYRHSFAFIAPREPVPLETAKPFAGEGMRLRSPRETKGMDFQTTSAPEPCCDDGNGKCC